MSQSMRRGQYKPLQQRQASAEKLKTQQGPVPDLLSNLPKPSKAQPARASSQTKQGTSQARKAASPSPKHAPQKTVGKRHEEDGIVFIDNENARAGDTEDNIPTTEEILEKAQEMDCNSVFEIDLRDRGLKSVPNLKTFRKTRILDLSSNKIERIAYLFNLKDLRELKLYDNAIQMLEGFDDLRELNVLQMQYNEITSIGGGLVNQKKLQQLRLDNNRLRKMLVKELCPCVQLTSLDVSFNNLDSIDAVTCLPNLEELLASNNQIKVLPEISRCKKLRELRISNNLLSDCVGLKNASSLRMLDLSFNHIFAVKEVGKMSQLEYLNIRKNNLQDVRNFYTYFPSVDVLILTDNRLEDANQCLEILSQMQSLSELTLSDNPMCENISSSDISKFFPNLEMFDGQPLKRSGNKRQLIGTPIMRPMSASTVISSKFVENQILALKDMMEPFESRMTSCYSSLRDSIDLLPTESQATPRSTTEEETSSRPSTAACSRRRRIHDAQEFAKRNFNE